MTTPKWLPIAQELVACALQQHDWRWIGPQISTIGDVLGPRDTYNVQCAKCGATTWAHGRMPALRAEPMR